MDSRLQNATCPVSVAMPMEPVFCPRALLGKAGLLLKTLLQHQPWRSSYSLDEDVFPVTGDPDASPIETAAIAHFKVIPLSVKNSLSTTSLGVAYRCLMTAKSVNTVSIFLFLTVIVPSGYMVMNMKCLSGR
jgi:hypothetical protein